MKIFRPLYQIVSVVIVALWSGGCGHHATVVAGGEMEVVDQAQFFEVRHAEGYTELTVCNPWDTTRALKRYLLVPRDGRVPDGLPEGVVVRTPLQRVAVASAVHAAMIAELGMMHRVVAVCEPQYMNFDSIRNGVQRGRIADLGSAELPDVERLVGATPDAIVVSAFENGGNGRIEKTGIPVIECVDYMEQTPLGRAEWLRFMGVLFGREQQATNLYNQTRCAYDSLCALTAKVARRPTVFTERKYGSAWYTAGGRSYIARVLRDAGAHYLWADDPRTGSVQLPFESVLERAAEAQFWLLKYNASKPMSYKELGREYAPYRQFGAFKRRNVYVCNTQQTPYYERLPIHPEELLEDMIRIFHPELLGEGTMHYYNRMEQ